MARGSCAVAAKAWKPFKLSAISSFTYVETVDLGFTLKLASDSFRLTRPVSDPNINRLHKTVIDRIGPHIEARTFGGRQTGFDREQRLA